MKRENMKKTALIYCDSQFGLIDGKTASGLVRHSEIYTIVGVIDSLLVGQDAGEVLQEGKKNIPIFKNLVDALNKLPNLPDYYIYGKAPIDTHLSEKERYFVLEAIEKGMNIINGLHQLLSKDQEFIDKAHEANVSITDVRKSPLLKDLHIFSGQVAHVTIPIVAVLGTDCACGKMTTAIELHKALVDLKLKSILIATGQTGLMQGFRYGIPIDALASQFVIGEIEHAILKAIEHENPDIILIEGQSALSHPAFMSTFGILKGSLPHGIIMQHAPARKFRCDFPHLPMLKIEHEFKSIKAVSDAKMLGITLNHEYLTDQEVLGVIKTYEDRFHIPTTDVLKHGCQKLTKALAQAFPALNKKMLHAK